MEGGFVVMTRATNAGIGVTRYLQVYTVLSQALAEGSFGQDGVFHAKALQAKCASKYAPAKPGDPASGTPNSEPPKSMTEREGSKVGVTL